MKIRFATFDIAKYGGIISHLEAKFKVLKDMGHDVDIILLEYKNPNMKTYESKLKKLESGAFQSALTEKSQNGGMSKDPITGYWRNNYHGWLLRPGTNRMNCLTEEGLQQWYKAVEGVDLILWSFVPTKTSEAKGFNWWHRYFELPETTKQVLTVHDAYYDVRNSWTNLLKSKISFFECVHITSYKVSESFDIPRLLNILPRNIEKKASDFKGINEKPIDFFSACIWKSMKRMEDLIASMPYLKNNPSVMVAGSGIELYYMASEEEKMQKPRYMVTDKTDPDHDPKDAGKTLWQRGVEHGMEYIGMITNEEVNFLLSNAKFAVDPSFSTHYAKYVNTHLNGFIIEAIVNGCYPVLRNYRDDVLEDDFIFRELKAIYIPRDATPTEFASYLNEALNMSPEQYKADIKHNLELAKTVLDPKVNMQLLLTIVQDEELIKSLEVGKATNKIKNDALDEMVNFFKYEELPEWMLDGLE